MTSFTSQSPTGTGSITASFTGGGVNCGYTAVQYIPVTGNAASPPAGSAPQGVTFPHGLFDFRIVGCTPGSAITMTIVYPVALPSGTQYWKYGSTASDATPHWYILPAAIAGNTATFTITDGGLGDDDLAANGQVLDQGGPGFGGPGAPAVPALSGWAMVLLSIFLGLLGAFRMRRR